MGNRQTCFWLRWLDFQDSSFSQWQEDILFCMKILHDKFVAQFLLFYQWFAWSLLLKEGQDKSILRGSNKAALNVIFGKENVSGFYCWWQMIISIMHEVHFWLCFCWRNIVTLYLTLLQSWQHFISSNYCFQSN